MYWSPRSSQAKTLKKGCEKFHKNGEKDEFDICDFWLWAYSDLLDNTNRGVLAEFLVARALDRTGKPRAEWGAFDIQTKTGLKVEVKSTAYAQNWKQKAPATVGFDIAPQKSGWCPEEGKSETIDPPRRTADVYVFCLLGSSDDPDPDPLDLKLWSFYVVATATLDRKFPTQKSVVPSKIKKLAGQETPYDQLDDEVERACQQRP